MVDNMLMHAQEYAEAQKRYAEQSKEFAGEHENQDTGNPEVGTKSEAMVPTPRLKRREFVAKGPHHFVTGVLKGVHCDNPALDLTVAASGKDLTFHADNYFTLPFTTLGFQPKGDLNPCVDLENRPAKVEYLEAADPAVTAKLVSIELHK